MKRILKSNWIIAFGLLLGLYGAYGTFRQAVAADRWVPAVTESIAPAINEENAAVEFERSVGRTIIVQPHSPLMKGEVVIATPRAKIEAAPRNDMLSNRSYLPEQKPVPEMPVRLVIPSIGLDAPIVPAVMQEVKVGKNTYRQWQVPDQYAVGWHASSAWLGEPGNTVFNGHHNVHGEVFGHLVDVNVGDQIEVYSSDSLFTYIITNKMILPEKYQQLDVRMNNAQWILPSQDERLTLITCWPYETNTHRLILVARPIGREKLARPFN